MNKRAEKENVVGKGYTVEKEDVFEKNRNQFLFFRDKFPALASVEPTIRSIYAKGRKEVLQSDFYVGIVGTRKATTYGLKAAEMFATHLARRGCCVVSGLAMGIDAVSHKGALSVGGKTIGVSATGIDGIYPRTNRRLFEKMEKEACIISEELGTMDAQRFRFPLRNRIVAAISDLLIVVDAPMKSGALITARMALELGKTVAAVPGSIFSYNSVGSNKLIEDGAFPLCSTLQLDHLVEYLVHRRIDNNYEQYIRDSGLFAATDSETFRYTVDDEERGLSANLRMDWKIRSAVGKNVQCKDSISALENEAVEVDEKCQIVKQDVLTESALLSERMMGDDSRKTENSGSVSNRILRNIENRNVIRKEREVSLAEYTSSIINILRKKSRATVFEISDLVSLSITDCMDILDELCNEGLVRYEDGDSYCYIRKNNNS